MHLIKYSNIDIDFGIVLLYVIKNDIILLIASVYDFNKDISRLFLNNNDIGGIDSNWIGPYRN
jgi:hypothetical protein